MTYVKTVLMMIVVVVVIVSSAGRADEALPPQAKLPAPGPDKGGLASLYPGDENLELDPRVLFVEDFETGPVKEIGERWGSLSQSENVTLSDDIHVGSPGVKSIHIAENGHLFTHTKGVDTMYARFYVKFHPKMGRNHHFVHLGADRIPTPWAKGRAGITPAGDGWFSTGIEPSVKGRGFVQPGTWHFYTYWHQMKTRWGTVYQGKPEQIEPGRWYCMEVMLKANSSPEKSDGEQAFWVDGKLQGHFKGFNWRTSDKLKINSFWLLFYNTRRQPDRTMEVWFDDVVLATEYVGPVVGKPKAGKKAARPSRSALQVPGLLLPVPKKKVHEEKFDGGQTPFKGGEIAEGGIDDSKAYAFGPKGCSVWDEYSTKVTDSTVIRFKLKPLADISSATVMIWSAKLKDNCRYRLGRLRKGQWRKIELRGIACRSGWGMNGPSLEDSVLNNFKLIHAGRPGDRILIDDFEISE